ncbi:MAG: hypothetical protein NZ578_12555 [Candidatus Binatia bacterium]|nr:hypothetical protein [Candidatus Binatia bacterium]
MPIVIFPGTRWTWLSALDADATVDSMNTVFCRGVVVLAMSVSLLGWSGCSARTREKAEGAQSVQEQPAPRTQSAPSISELPSLETFAAFLDRA